jgi:hypothetical protein
MPSSYGRFFGDRFGYNVCMPIHDWTKVSSGTFHALHVAWIAEIQRCLNSGLLPSNYYALAEQVASNIIPDVLTLQDWGSVDAAGVRDQPTDGDDGGVAVATKMPTVSVRDTISESVLLASRRRRVAIRHTSGDRIVALLEIISHGNKEKQGAVEQFIDKAATALDQGLHLQVIDLFPPGPFDPNGMHGALWSRLGGRYELPPDKPLTLAAYAAAGAVTCYVEPTSVGTMLVDMPLFLTPGRYVNVPLERTYLAAYQGLPQRWKRVIEAV